MARFGKGKPIPEQAQRILRKQLSLSSRHAAKAQSPTPGARSTDKLHSLRTYNAYVKVLAQAGTWIQTHYGIKRLDEVTSAQANAYLEARQAQGYSQKTLSNDRCALRYLVDPNALAKPKSLTPTTLKGRAYTGAQVTLIADRQSAKNALATHIAYRAGLRAHELLTLRRADEAKPSGHRQWDTQRFRGREGARYIVTGKGGLHREVLIPKALAQQLETRRLPQPVAVTDRGIHYRSHYDIGGGNAWSKSFSSASKHWLGWSTGAHGLRHSYAQERLQELQNHGVPFPQAKAIVSQEVGHFRPGTTDAYLR